MFTLINKTRDHNEIVKASHQNMIDFMYIIIIKLNII